MSDLTNPIRGARDFYPQELAVRNWLFSKWREVAVSFGYEEIDGPLLESFDLYSAKSGEELVNQQMYTLQDRDDRKLGVRPELTPTYSRLVAKRQNELTFPLRWMMFGQVWRYEKPQTGRTRDFWQWELNLVGGNETLTDAEVVVISIKALRAIGLGASDIVLRINDRRFMQEKLASFGISGAQYESARRAIDKKEKITQPEFDLLLTEAGISQKSVTLLNDFLANPSYTDSPTLVALFDKLNSMGVSDYVKYDPLIVRGITYYTGVVFECFDRSKKFRSIFGGGRFDDLVETFGGGKIPAVGYAIGDVVVTELLKSLGKLPLLNPVPTQVLVTIFDKAGEAASLSVSNSLRSVNIPTETYPDSALKLEKQLKYADKKAIPYVVIIGPEEQSANKVVLKDLVGRTQQLLTLEEVIAKLSVS